MFAKKLLPIFTATVFLFLLGINTTRKAEPTFTVIRGSVAAPEEKSAVVNINTADTEALTALPGIGDVLAERIVAYRTENGSFEAIEDIMNVSGIGQKKFEAISELICAN